MPNDHAPSSDRPLLTSTSWNDEWKMIQKDRGPGNTAAYWNERAKTFSSGDSPSAYVEEFLNLAALRPGESVFDMGCGNGALAIPLALAGHDVIAADFSSTMLDVMERSLEKRGIPYRSYKDPSSPLRFDETSLVSDSTDSSEQHAGGPQSLTPSPDSDAEAPSDHPDHPLVVSKLLSWDDDWVAAGIPPKSVDVAFASRSITTFDLQDSLLRLNEVARRRVCITLSTGSSPRIDATLLREIGVTDHFGRDYLYAFMILSNLGFQPEVRFIRSTRNDSYDSPEDAYRALHRMIVDATGRSASDVDLELYDKRLREWVRDNVVANASAKQSSSEAEIQDSDQDRDCDRDREKAYTLRRPRVVSWAFISWNVDDRLYGTNPAL